MFACYIKKKTDQQRQTGDEFQHRPHTHLLKKVKYTARSNQQFHINSKEVYTKFTDVCKENRNFDPEMNEKRWGF